MGAPLAGRWSRLDTACSSPLNHALACAPSSALIVRQMRLRFRAARSVRSTRYAILGADFVKHCGRGAGATVPQILKPLSDALGSDRLRRKVKKVLVGFGVLHHCRRLAVHRQYHRALGVFEVPHDFRRVRKVVIGWMSLVM